MHEEISPSRLFLDTHVCSEATVPLRVQNGDAPISRIRYFIGGKAEQNMVSLHLRDVFETVFSGIELPFRVRSG